MLMLTMSRILSELLGAKEPTFSLSLRRLEQATGEAGVDVRLTAEIVSKVQQKIRQLALDPEDTTGAELYAALQGLAGLHDQFIARRLGAVNHADVNDVLPRLKKFVENIESPKHAWVIKHNVAKRLIKASPPKQVMKYLKYRSVDSFVKRENIDEIFSVAFFAESTNWQRRLIKSYKKLQPSDFEVRDVKVILLSKDRWGELIDQHRLQHSIVCQKEMGVIAIMPLMFSELPGISLAVLPALLHFVNEIRTYSTFFKLQQVRPNFGNVLVESIRSDVVDHASIGGQKLHWRVLQRYFSKAGIDSFPELFGPHVQYEDLQWFKIEEILYRLEPALHFWHDVDFVGTYRDNGPISFNILDVAACYLNKKSYEQRIATHLQRSLWNELMGRYIGQGQIAARMAQALDADETFDVLPSMNWSIQP